MLVDDLVEGLHRTFACSGNNALLFQDITVLYTFQTFLIRLRSRRLRMSLFFQFQLKTTFRFSQLKTTGRKGLGKSLSRFPLR